ncbi:MAG: helix-turn-helix domain-containing protein [Spartobacteria bacterium]
MRRIQLSGRERAVLKAVGFAEPVPGSAIAEHTQMPPDDLTDVLNALLAAGYVESKPYREQVSSVEMPAMEFEVNPGYVHELRTTMKRSWV